MCLVDIEYCANNLFKIMSEEADICTEEQVLRSSRVVAIVGLSSKRQRPSYGVGLYLKKQGYRVIPVNPREEKILGENSYASLSVIPEPVDVVDIFRRPDEVLEVVEEAIKIGAKAVWMQEEVVNDEAAARAREAGLEVVMDKCMKKEHQRVMGAEPLPPGTCELVPDDELES
jgi:predicted CoA-binding protein